MKRHFRVITSWMIKNLTFKPLCTIFFKKNNNSPFEKKVLLFFLKMSLSLTSLLRRNICTAEAGLRPTHSLKIYTSGFNFRHYTEAMNKIVSQLIELREGWDLGGC